MMMTVLSLCPAWVILPYFLRILPGGLTCLTGHRELLATVQARAALSGSTSGSAGVSMNVISLVSLWP